MDLGFSLALQHLPMNRPAKISRYVRAPSGLAILLAGLAAQPAFSADWIERVQLNPYLSAKRFRCLPRCVRHRLDPYRSSPLGRLSSPCSDLLRSQSRPSSDLCPSALNERVFGLTSQLVENLRYAATYRPVLLVLHKPATG